MQQYTRLLRATYNTCTCCSLFHTSVVYWHTSPWQVRTHWHEPFSSQSFTHVTPWNKAISTCVTGPDLQVVNSCSRKAFVFITVNPRIDISRLLSPDYFLCLCDGYSECYGRWLAWNLFCLVVRGSLCKRFGWFISCSAERDYLHARKLLDNKFHIIQLTVYSANHCIKTLTTSVSNVSFSDLYCSFVKLISCGTVGRTKPDIWRHHL